MADGVPTDKKKEDLSQILSHLAVMVEEGFILIDRERRVIMANEAAIRFFDQNLTGVIIDDVLSCVPPDDDLTACFEQAEGEAVALSKKRKNLRLRVRFCRLTEDTVMILLADMSLHKHLDKVQRDFVANVSHELRSPLTSLIGFIETLQNTKTLDEKTKDRFLAIMDEDAKRMSRLIDNLMSLSRVESAEHIVPDTKVFIIDVVKSVIASVANRAEKMGIDVIFTDQRMNPAAPLVVAGKIDEIMEVFHNLLDNALKYGAPESDVLVCMGDPKDNRVQFDVINYGEGIDDAHLPRLTERFYRVDKGRSRQMGGIGLGLAIVKHIVNRHRGSISITSERPGKTIFSIILPLITPAKL